MRPPPLADDSKACRILSWNVAGLRVRSGAWGGGAWLLVLSPGRVDGFKHGSAPGAQPQRVRAWQDCSIPRSAAMPHYMLQALLKKVKEAQEGRLEQNVPSLPALVEAEKADVLCLQVG